MIVHGERPIGRPDPDRCRRAQRLIERFHAGLMDAAAYVRGLRELYAEEFAEELGPTPAGTQPGDDDHDDLDDIRSRFPVHAEAPGLWLVLGDDRCQFCGRTLPVLALKPGSDDPGDWVRICLDDLELIRSQAEASLKPQ